MLSTFAVHAAARSLVAGALVATGALGATAFAPHQQPGAASASAGHEAASPTVGSGLVITPGAGAASPTAQDPLPSPAVQRPATPLPTRHTAAAATRAVAIHHVTTMPTPLATGPTAQHAAATMAPRPAAMACPNAGHDAPDAVHDGMGRR